MTTPSLATPPVAEGQTPRRRSRRATVAENRVRDRRITWFAVLVIIALGLRLLGLALQPLWWDEGFSLYFATESTPRLLELTSLDIHPPLYYLMLQGWFVLVGIGAEQARWLSVFFGILAVPLTWVVARRGVSHKVGWLAAWLMALSPFHIYYAQEVRMYSLLVVCALLAVRAWQVRSWVGLGLAIVAGLLTHYYFIFLALALGLLILSDISRGKVKWHEVGRTIGVALVGYLPWLIYALPRLLTYIGGKLVVEADTPMTPLEFLPRHLVAWSVGHLSPRATWVGWGALVFAFLIGVALWRRYTHRRHRRTRRVDAFIILWLLPAIGVFVLGLGAPFVDLRIERQLLFVLPFFLIVVAKGLRVLWEKRPLMLIPVTAALGLMTSFALADFYTMPRYGGEDYRPLLQEVSALQGPNDGWLAVYEWQIGYLRAYLPDNHPTPVAVEVGWADDPDALQAGVETLLFTYPRLWLPAYQVQGRLFESQLATALQTTGVPAWNEWYGNSRLYLFGQAPGTPSLTSLGNVAEIGAVEGAVGAATAPTGVGIIPVYLRRPPTAATARVSLQLVGRGAVWGEWDGPFEQASDMLRAGLPVAPGTPPGEYQIQASFYPLSDTRPLERTIDGTLAPVAAPLGTVTIERPIRPLPPATLQRLATNEVDITLEDNVRLLGTAWEGEGVLQGDSLPITLLWQSVLSTPTDALVFIQAINERGELKVAHESVPVGGSFPLSQWEAGDLVRDDHRLQLPADLPAGRYRLVVGLYDPITGVRLATGAGESAIAIGTFTVAERERILNAPLVGAEVNIAFAERAHLVQVNRGFTETISAGDPLTVTLLWRADATGGSPLRSFVQLYCGDKQLYSSDHGTPTPAPAWITGEYILDPHVIPVPTSSAPCAYRLIAGLVDATTGHPLPTAAGGYTTIYAP